MVTVSICAYSLWKWIKAKQRGNIPTKITRLGNFSIYYRLITTVVEISKENERKWDVIVQQRGITRKFS